MKGYFYNGVQITANFNLNALKFELQYEWSLPQMFFSQYRVLQLLCHIAEAHDIKCSQK